MSKSFLSYKTVTAVSGNPLELHIQGKAFFCVSITGTALVEFDSQENALPVLSRMGYQFTAKEQFKRLVITAQGGADATISFLVGVMTIISGGSGSGGGGQIVIGNANDPNVAGAVPTDTTQPAFYYRDQAAPVQFWIWSVANQNWFPAITA